MSVTKRCSKYRSKSICRLQTGLFNREMPQHTTQTSGRQSFLECYKKDEYFQISVLGLETATWHCEADPGFNMKCTFKKLGSASEAF